MSSVQVIVKSSGSFDKTFKFLNKLTPLKMIKLEKYAQMGIDALRAATPRRTGTTAECWYYKIETTKSSAKIIWLNANENKGIPIVVLIQYGHGTRNGGYVPPNDFINPAMRPVFEKIADAMWLEVIRDE